MNTGRIIFSQLMDFLPRTQIPPMRSSLRRRTTCADLLLLGSVPLHGLRAIDLSREPARHRDLPACAWQQTLPRRHSRQPLAQHAGRRQRKTRLAHLCRFRAGPHRPGAANFITTTASASIWNKTAYAFDSTTIDLCLSLFPWAQFRRHKSAVKLHTLIDLRGNIPCFIHITSGRVADVNGSRPSAHRARRLLHHGSRLHRFRTTLQLHTSSGLLRHPCQRQSGLSPADAIGRWTRPPACAAIRPLCWRPQDHPTLSRSTSPHRVTMRRTPTSASSF